MDNMKRIGHRLVLITGVVEIISVVIIYFGANSSLVHMSGIWVAEEIPVALRSSQLRLMIMCAVTAVVMIALTALCVNKILFSFKDLNTQLSSLKSKDEIYLEVIESQTVGTLVTDAKTAAIVMVNKMALKLFEIEKDVSGLNVMDFRCKFDEEGDKSFVSYLMELRKGKGEVEFEQPLYLNDGSCVHILVNAKRVILSNGNNVIIYSFMNITDRKKLEENLLILSETDFLTGICNRRSGEYRTEKIIEGDGHGMFCLFDVDKFKYVNDNYGHTAGDNVLVAIAKIMKKTFRSSDVLIRLGGDEFVIFADGIEDRDIGVQLIKRFIGNIEKMEVEGLDGHKICISLGALMVLEKLSFAEMYRRTDSLMYDCKAKEGNTFLFYED